MTNPETWSHSNGHVDKEDMALLECYKEWKLATKCLVRQINDVTSCLRRSKKHLHDFAEIAESLDVRRKRV